MREFQFFESIIEKSVYVLSRAINFGRQCHFKIWLDCHKFKKIPCLIMSGGRQLGTLLYLGKICSTTGTSTTGHLGTGSPWITGQLGTAVKPTRHCLPGTVSLISQPVTRVLAGIYQGL
jgi:hypothetical protein